ncbi:unnamed protein product [Paramecium octaurelia]|uniref:RING-type domain-containing protein n=1 Tax=Paramecium octaurelia TaxID=43137 RepID=A0A8S1UM72_PAROT|nr:unnamed protein product [Paramecium octaurelia]
MELNNIIEIIADSGNRGKELMMDSFIVGVAWGRKLINTIQEIQQATNYLYQLNQEVELSQKTAFYKLDLFQKFLLEDNCQLFPQVEAKFQQLPQEEIKQEPKVNNNNRNESLCGICNFQINDLPDEKFKIPYCGHEFHNLCLYQEIDQKDQAKCSTCSIQLDPTVKKDLLKLISPSFRSCCPFINCQQEFIYYGQSTFTCQNCNIPFCLKCKQIEHNNQCNLGIDYIEMRQGQRFKLCFDCQEIIILNFQDLSSHQCKTQKENQNTKHHGIFNKIARFLKKDQKY